MKTNADTWFATSIDRLNDPLNQRVWSVIVTVFGDLAQRPGDKLSGGVLTQIISPMGIKPEAIRVALHRLRKDGWLESTRSGRTSEHFLTPFGREQSAEVTPRIYDRAPQTPTDWHVLMAEEGTALDTLDEVLLARTYISLGRSAALGHGRIPPNCDDLLVFHANTFAVPDWLKTRIFPTDLSDSCQRLLTDVQSISLPPPDLSPLEIAILRTLIVHRWRRVVLRHMDLPRDFHPDAWPGQACRNAVFALLDQLPRPEVSALQSSIES
jgi:phenylacetic acid degradation operon negative regulatory protein